MIQLSIQKDHPTVPLSAISLHTPFLYEGEVYGVVIECELKGISTEILVGDYLVFCFADNVLTSLPSKTEVNPLKQIHEAEFEIV